MTIPNYYEVLGVSEDASDEDIRKAYKACAFKEHPDRNPNDQKGAEERFKKINEAFDVLSKRRQEYDFTRNNPNPFNNNVNVGSGDPYFSYIQEQFGNFFGRQQQHHHYNRESPSVFKGHINISLKDTITGTNIPGVTVKSIRDCPGCYGTGVNRDNVSSTRLCDACKGAGGIRKGNNMMNIVFQCNVCQGTGKLFPTCTECHGTCTKEETKTVDVPVPIGIKPEQVIVLDNNTTLIGVNVSMPDDIESIDIAEGHVHKHIEVLYTQILLGEALTVKLLDDSEGSFRLPKGIQPGQFVRLKGKGLPKNPRQPTQFGDLLLVINLKWPIDANNLEPEHEKLLKKLNKVYTKQHNNG